jgi:hypothetical protein
MMGKLIANQKARVPIYFNALGQGQPNSFPSPWIQIGGNQTNWETLFGGSPDRLLILREEPLLSRYLL